MKDRPLSARARSQRRRRAVFENALMSDFEANGAEAIAAMRKAHPAKYVQTVDTVVARGHIEEAEERRRAERAARDERARPAPEPPADEPELSEEEQQRRAARLEALRARRRREPGDEG